MLRPTRTLLIGLALPLAATPLGGQDAPTLGLNLQVVGTSRVGVTWLASPSVAIRPSLQASWQQIENPFGGESEASQIGLTLDVLFTTARRDPVTTYLGVGAVLLNRNADGNADNSWGVQGLLGVRVAVLRRLALFGEVTLSYAADESFDRRLASLFTTPIGVVVFLK